MIEFLSGVNQRIKCLSEFPSETPEDLLRSNYKESFGGSCDGSRLSAFAGSAVGAATEFSVSNDSASLKKLVWKPVRLTVVGANINGQRAASSNLIHGPT